VTLFISEGCVMPKFEPGGYDTKELIEVGVNKKIRS